MRQRRFQFVEDVAVHVRRLSKNFETNILAEPLRQIVNHPRESLNAVREGTHTARKDLAVETMSEVVRTIRKDFQIGNAGAGKLLALDPLLRRLRSGMGLRGVNFPGNVFWRGIGLRHS